MTGAYEDLRVLEVPIDRACTLIGRSRATHYRHLRAPVQGPRKPPTVPDNGQALRTTERAGVLSVINAPQYADLAICQIWARELDEGNYWCSMSSMYRIASAAGQNQERRRQATHAAKVKPELLADGPSQVWTWDITKLRGPTKGVWFHLYVLIDIYSRYNPSWIVSHHESAELAEAFIEEAIARNGDVPHTVHDLGDANAATTPSPVWLNRKPSWDSIAMRNTSSWAARAARMPSASVSHRRVEPSISVNRNVTTPEGGAPADTRTGFHKERGPTSNIVGLGSGHLIPVCFETNFREPQMSSYSEDGRSAARSPGAVCMSCVERIAPS
jgi:transposase InsO family protein